ncbi:LysR family transcriptional regulator, partial [Burkholderia pseudomallei]
PEFTLASLANAAAVAGQGELVCRQALVDDQIARGRLVNVCARRVPAPAQSKAICARPQDAREKAFVGGLRAESDRYA